MNDPVTLSSLVAASTTPGPVRPAIMVVAFEGWNDAGDAASSALKDIKAATGAVKVAGIGDDDYYDYQFSRPQVRRNAAGKRVIKWPTTRIYRASLPDAPVDLLLVRGVEPTYRWKAFITEILTRAEEENVQGVMALGSLLADVPHSRPIQAAVSSDDPAVREALGAQPAAYEGPTGILGVLAQFAEAAGLPTLSIWAAVPHYVAQPPSPKAQLALLHRVEELLPLVLDLHELGEDALAWERGVDALATGDADIAAYVQQLEQAQDETELPEATGEAIAREFERYLKRRHLPGAAGEQGPGTPGASGPSETPDSPDVPDTPGPNA
ncbi:PAC2 family protein [Paeniglutamicibacter sp.]|uniref:PAC2 family protein n=1 Tax=Paeniglutamicibacter sp. TaxID=1934391 RepID=UPI003989D9BA